MLRGKKGIALVTLILILIGIIVVAGTAATIIAFSGKNTTIINDDEKIGKMESNIKEDDNAINNESIDNKKEEQEKPIYDGDFIFVIKIDYSKKEYFDYAGLGKTYIINLPEKNEDVLFKYDFKVDWGDGTQSHVKSFDDSNARHTYTENGEYKIKINGIAEGGIRFYPEEVFFSKITELQSQSVELSTERTKQAQKVIQILTPYPSSMKIIQTNFDEYFFRTRIEEIPENIFVNIAQLKSAEWCFSSSSIKSIPEKVFKYNPALESVQSAFSACNDIENIPNNLFKYNTELKNISGVFSGCDRIENIPEDIFRYNIKAENFDSTFSFCSGITSIPENIFKYNTIAKSFKDIFEACSIRMIPSNLFRYNTEAVGFDRAFSENKSLEEIPEDLFKYNTKANSFRGTFSKCYKIKSFPNNLFDYIDNKKAEIIFDACFLGCEELEGSAVKLWKIFPNASGKNCYHNCEKLSNYNQIPDNWKN